MKDYIAKKTFCSQCGARITIGSTVVLKEQEEGEKEISRQNRLEKAEKRRKYVKEHKKTIGYYFRKCCLCYSNRPVEWGCND